MGSMVSTLLYQAQPGASVGVRRVLRGGAALAKIVPPATACPHACAA